MLEKVKRDVFYDYIKSIKGLSGYEKKKVENKNHLEALYKMNGRIVARKLITKLNQPNYQTFGTIREVECMYQVNDADLNSYIREKKALEEAKIAWDEVLEASSVSNEIRSFVSALLADYNKLARDTIGNNEVVKMGIEAHYNDRMNKLETILKKL